jgi:hypothetical protein
VFACLSYSLTLTDSDSVRVSDSVCVPLCMHTCSKEQSVKKGVGDTIQKGRISSFQMESIDECRRYFLAGANLATRRSATPRRLKKTPNDFT